MSVPIASVSAALTRLEGPGYSVWRELHTSSGTEDAWTYFELVLAPGRYLMDSRVTVDWDHGGQGTRDARASISTTVGVRTSCLADIAGVGGTRSPDGELTADDLIVYLSSYFATSTSPINLADIAGVGGRLGSDGRVTADDLIAYLRLFIEGCP